MGEPPVEMPLFQARPITDAVVIAGKFASPTGADGTRTMIAPFPLFEVAEFP